MSGLHHATLTQVSLWADRHAIYLLPAFAYNLARLGWRSTAGLVPTMIRANVVLLVTQYQIPPSHVGVSTGGGNNDG